MEVQRFWERSPVLSKKIDSEGTAARASLRRMDERVLSGSALTQKGGLPRAQVPTFKCTEQTSAPGAETYLLRWRIIETLYGRHPFDLLHET